MKTTMQLPDDPGELLNLALDDLEACEQDPAYEIDMWVWHVPSRLGSGLCYVCLAGSVIAQHSDASISKSLSPCDFDDDTRKKLMAVNRIRAGLYEVALALLGLDMPVITAEPGYSIWSTCPPSYQTNPKYFKTYFRQVAICLSDLYKAQKEAVNAVDENEIQKT